MKKILSFVMAIAMALVFAGCGKSPKAEESGGMPQVPVQEKPEFPRLEAGAVIPEGCTYVTADGKTLQAGTAMPAEVRETDRFVTPEFIYWGDRCLITVNSEETVLGWVAQLNETNISRAGVTEFTELMFETINGLPLFSLKGTFHGCVSIVETPAIPDTVLDMNGTFSDCRSLQNVGNLPQNLNNLTAAFSGCSSLKNVPEIPEKTALMDGAFSGCASLERIPDFSGCTELQQLNHVFEGCMSLREACDIPECVTAMESTFQGCTALSGRVNILSRDIRADACKDVFAGCSGLTLTGKCPRKVLKAIAKTGTGMEVS